MGWAGLVAFALLFPRPWALLARHRWLLWYDTTQTVAAFSARLREQLDLDTLSAKLLTVAEQTMQPTQVSLWLRPRASPQALGRAGQRASVWTWSG